MHEPLLQDAGNLSRNVVLALIGVTLALHTVEEYLTFPAFLASPNLPGWLHPSGLVHSPQELRIALVIATVLPLAVIAWAILRPRKALLVAALLVEAVLMVNAAWHLIAMVVRGGYAPGVITAVLINLPFGIYVLCRAVKEQWISAAIAWQLTGVAVVLHLLALGRLLAG